MKRFGAFFVALALCLPAMAQVAPPPIPGGAASMPLIAGGGNATSGVDVGDVYVWLDLEGNLCIQYMMDPGFCLKEVHTDVQWSWQDFPQTKTGNPKVGHFAYSKTNLGCIAWLKWVIPLEDLINDAGEIPGPGSVICIAAHAVVRSIQGGICETAWAGDQEFPGNNWATYFCIPLPSETPPLLEVGGTVWWDCDNDGMREEGEGVAYLTSPETGAEPVAAIVLRNVGTGETWGPVNPDVNGQFLFSSLMPGFEGMTPGTYELLIVGAFGSIGLSPQNPDPSLNDQAFVPDNPPDLLEGATAPFLLDETTSPAVKDAGFCGQT